MIDESRLQVRAKDGDAALNTIKTASCLIARGHREATAILARELSEGLGDLRRDAEDGLTGAQHFLGLAYYYGLGVARDYVQALMWLDLAGRVSLEIEGLSTNYHDVAAKMTSEQIAQAQILASHKRSSPAWQSAQERLAKRPSWNRRHKFGLGRSVPGLSNLGMSDEVLAALCELEAPKIVNGAVTFAEWSADFLEIYGERIGLHLAKIWIGSQILGLPGMAKQLETPND